MTAHRSPLSLIQRRGTHPECRGKEVQSIPWKRGVEPWEIARLAVYLASEDADCVAARPPASAGA